jgi:hypothetical protein
MTDMASGKQYIVQQGDTLGGIAQDHGTTAAELQRINPIIRDPNRIQEGWKLQLPADTRAANESSATVATSKQAALPPSQHSQDASSAKAQCNGACTSELVDIVHVTGDDHFYVLTEEQANHLKAEVKRVQALMDEFTQIVSSAADSLSCKKEKNPQATCACIRCKKAEWGKKAEVAGLVKIGPPAPAPEPQLVTEQDIQGRIRSLQQARDWYQNYEPSLLKEGPLGNVLENNWPGLKSAKVRELNAEIAALRARLSSEPPASSTTGSGARPSADHGRSRTAEYERGRQTHTGHGVVEVALFSQPDRRYYIPVRYREQVSWTRKVRTALLNGKPFGKALAKDLIDDIKKGVGGDGKASPLGKLEAKIKTWEVPENCLLNALHKEASWSSNPDDSAPYAAQAEGHLLRFAASASAGINSWDPKNGEIEVGVKGSAAFSLAEGRVALESYFPSQGGRTVQMAYRNALGKTVYHPFGSFRLLGKVELSAFAGAHAQGSAGVKVNYKPTEQPSGATALLGTPSTSTQVSRGGQVGLKADAFAGAQAGGSLTGAMQWIEPAKEGRGKVEAGQANASSSWGSLAEIKAEGNLAFGIGAAFDFGISISNNRLALNCKAALVFGPGAGGGFATVADLEKIYDLVSLVCGALAEVDYRSLLSIDPKAFNYIAWGLYQAASAPRTAAKKVFEMGYREMTAWWTKRKALMEEAEHLAASLLAHQAVLINGKKLPLHKLPPETLGPMLYVLSESFVESFESEQEKAIVLLLSHIRRWRHFIETLEHMSPKANKVNAMESLNRLNTFLDRNQQQQFNRFIDRLAVNETATPSAQLAWTPIPLTLKRDVMLAAQRSGHFDGMA